LAEKNVGSLDFDRWTADAAGPVDTAGPGPTPYRRDGTLMTRGRRSVLWLVWIACVVLTRLPLLLSPDLIPDADEAVLGLMAKHVAAGERLPIFFAGQAYGFSFLEAGGTALFFRLFGVATVALKVAMLLIWMAGGALMIAAVDRLGGRRAAWLSLALLAACPGWSEWSMRARGGYLTAFVLSGLALYLCSRLRADRNRHWSLTAALGATATLVPLAQPIWSPVVLSLVALLLLERRRLHDLAGLAAGAGLVLGSVALAITLEPDSVWTPGLTDPAALPDMLVSLPGDVITGMSGIYLLGQDFSSSPWTKLAGVLWSVALVCVIIRAAGIVKSQPWLGWTTLLSVGAVLAAYPLISRGLHAYRYFLPLLQVMIVFLALQLPGRGWSARLATGVLILCGLIALLETPRCFFGASRGRTGDTLATALDRLADHLLTRGVHHAYATGGFCLFTLPFLTEERIRARGLSTEDRLPENARAVDRALRGGEKTALIGPLEVLALLADRLRSVGVALPEEMEVIGGTFIVAHDPTPEQLKACWFVLHAEP